MEHLLAYVPYLLCPLAMGLMMWMMSRGAQNGTAGPRQKASPTSVRDRSQPDERVGRLRAELAELHAQQDAVAAKIRERSSGAPAGQLPLPPRP